MVRSIVVPGAYVLRGDILRARERVDRAYEEAGYASVDVDASPDQDRVAHTLGLTVIVDPGPATAMIVRTEIETELTVDENAIVTAADLGPATPFQLSRLDAARARVQRILPDDVVVVAWKYEHAHPEEVTAVVRIAARHE